MAKVYIIWDNSNIHYGGLNQVFPIKEPGQQKELYRTHFLNLLNLVVGNREIGQVYFVGSTPPESDSIWAYLRSVGIKPETIPRSTAGGENNTTDYLLQNHLLRLGYLSEKGTIALLSGDGAGIYKDEGFFADLKKLHNVVPPAVSLRRIPGRKRLHPGSFLPIRPGLRSSTACWPSGLSSISGISPWAGTGAYLAVPGSRRCTTHM